MKKIVIKTQAALDKLTQVEEGQEVIIEAKTDLTLNASIEVFGVLRIRTLVKMTGIWSYNRKIVVARGNSSVEAWGKSSVVAWGKSSVVAWENSSVVAWGKSSVVAWENSSVVARGNSSVEAWGKSSVVAWGKSSVVAWENSSVVAWGNSSVVAWENSSVEAWGWSIIRFFASVKLEVKSDFATLVPWKQEFKTKRKTIVYKQLSGGLIATLELKKGQVFQSQWHGKCRTDSAKVLKIEDGDEEVQVGYSQHDSKFKYEVGATVSAEYDERITECSTGIHFFLSRDEAERY